VPPARPKPHTSFRVQTQPAAPEWHPASSCLLCARAARPGRLGANAPLRPAQVQDRAVESSEIWREGRLLYERLQTLPNYEKCAAAARPVRPAWSLRCADTERTALPRRWVRSHFVTGPPWRLLFPVQCLLCWSALRLRTGEGSEGAAVALHDDLSWRLRRLRLVRCMEKRWSNYGGHMACNAGAPDRPGVREAEGHRVHRCAAARSLPLTSCMHPAELSSPRAFRFVTLIKSSAQPWHECCWLH